VTVGVRAMIERWNGAGRAQIAASIPSSS